MPPPWPGASAHRPTEAPGAQYVTRHSVTASTDWVRVNALPRRQWSPESAAPLVEKWTSHFRAPFGTMRLHPVQAQCLEEAVQNDGLVASLSVGAGKTLLSFLLPLAMGAKRPVLVGPASVMRERKHDWVDLAKHWRLGSRPVFASFESFQTVAGKEHLADLNPDLLVIDEAHGLRSSKAARTKRFRRWLGRPESECRVCVMTGTFGKRRLEDYAHLCLWALGAGAPIPIEKSTLEEWDTALAEKLELGTRSDPGALLRWYDGPTDGVSFLEQGRRGFQKRFSETPGVVVYSVPSDDLPPLAVVGHQLDHSGELLDAFRLLRDLRELPDGQQLVDAIEWYRHAKELALGFFLKWKYPGPPEWLAARKAWFGFCRTKLERSRTYDSPDDLAKAFPDQPEWLAWKGIRDSFKPETVPVWIETGIAKLCAQWLTGEWGEASPGSGGVVFTEHVEFGRLVAHLAGVPYFGEEGLDDERRSIVHYRDPRGCVASVGSNGKGRNLQHFCRMLIPSPLPNGPQWEQCLGREHRQGQKWPVRCDVLFGCQEAYQAFWQAMADARRAEDTEGMGQKLLSATVTVGQCPVVGWQWGKVGADE